MLILLLFLLSLLLLMMMITHDNDDDDDDDDDFVLPVMRMSICLWRGKTNRCEKGYKRNLPHYTFLNQALSTDEFYGEYEAWCYCDRQSAIISKGQTSMTGTRHCISYVVVMYTTLCHLQRGVSASLMWEKVLKYIIYRRFNRPLNVKGERNNVKI